MSSARKVYTSVTHPIRIDWLDPSVAGPVGLTFAPGKKSISLSGVRWDRDLDVDLTALIAQGVGVLVCLLEDRDLAPNGIADLFVQAEQHGLEVLRLPIPDQGVPADPGDVDRHLDALDARVRAGSKVVIHCLGGLGRTGVIGGCWLIRRGLSADEALAMLRQVRNDDRCPETHGQRAFIESYAVRLRERLAGGKASGSGQ